MNTIQRREFMYGLGASLGSVAFTSLLQADELVAKGGPLAPRPRHLPAKAKACIMLFMAGGPSHIDTFDPKPKLLSERLGVSEREIVDMDQRLDGWDLSLDAPFKDDSDTERIEFLSTTTESIEDKVAKKEIEALLHTKIAEFRKKMTPREKEIFDLRIFSDNPVTLQEIGDRYGISRERVRQVEKNIVKKMREFFKREIPDFAAYTEESTAE